MTWKRTISTCVAALAALVLSAGCGSGDSSSQHPADHGSSTSASSSPDHNDTDAGFAENMIPHHQQAVEMSDILLAKQGIDPRIIDLATKIKAAQGPEIKQMQGWLSQWDIPPMSNEGHDMGGNSMGMMSPAQMTALKNAQGVEAGKLFLNGMIAHHEGAVAMAQAEIGNGQFQPAVALAKTIATTQQQEIDTMKGILATL
ncbi:MAG TPA: DUF305 domain-containing protein [Mycobacterium sp.]|nr:DUF305 domain-containing protein [Mycobacterium sp.]